MLVRLDHPQQRPIRVCQLFVEQPQGRFAGNIDALAGDRFAVIDFHPLDCELRLVIDTGCVKHDHQL